MSEYEQITHEKGKFPKWEHFPKLFKISCCHCELVHEVKVKVDSRGKVWMKWRQDLRATAARRRFK